MSAQSSFLVAARDDVLAGAADPLAVARARITAVALRDTAPGPGAVGLELEFHLVDLAEPLRRPRWDEVEPLLAELPAMPSGSRVTVEPGGQLELSPPPATDVTTAVAALQADRRTLATSLRGTGFGTAPLGADPARPLHRVNPSARYVAMQEHFAAMGCAGAGSAMMTSTAALQVNLDAGPRAGWSRRMSLIRDLGPVLVAVSACSPYLAGRASGWRSMRQQAWQGIDHQRSDAVPAAEPAQAWATYALDAPVLLVRTGDAVRPVTERVTFGAWLRDPTMLGRPATIADVDYHLTTLFPPIRPRGYVEIRCLDAVPDRWWPALAGLTATLLDDERAADQAAEACAPLRDAWEVAARDGLADPGVYAAARTCAAVAARHSPAALRAEMESLAELVERGRTPGDELRDLIEAVGPAAALRAEALRPETQDDVHA